MWLLDKIFFKKKMKSSEKSNQDFNDEELIKDFQKLNWEKKKWLTTIALVEKDGSSVREYVGQRFNTKYFEIKEDGWTHDHCEICYITISEGDNNLEFEIEGYNHGNKWICNNCYSQHIEMKNENIDK